MSAPRLRLANLLVATAAFAPCALPGALKAQQAPPAHYLPGPAFDTSSIDASADPCSDFYKFACGKFAANHPIPSDQSGVDQFYVLYNVNTEELNGILNKYAAANPSRTPNEQKIGDYYAACMNTDLIDKKGLAPVKPLLDEIDKVSKTGIAYLDGELQRYGVDAMFSFNQMPDYKDSTMTIAVIGQGGLGLPERDYYTRTGDKDKKLRDQYIEHITKILTLLGETPQQAAADAKDILVFETKLAEASLTVTEMRDPAAVYHMKKLSEFEAGISGVDMKPFFDAIHAPAFTNINDSTPKFFPALVSAVRETDIATLRAYLRYHTVTTFAGQMPHNIDAENFAFYGTVLQGQPQQRPRWKRCSQQVDNSLGEALGQVYVQQYFAGDSKEKTLQMVHDIEAAMATDIDQLDWMSDVTKVKAKEKLHAVADKIGYPERWRDYTKVIVTADDALGNAKNATAFENDRELDKINKPVDRSEWQMTPPTVNAYYDPTMNNINFPAGILQPAFYDPKADIATNYGHIGAVIGHELTHGFDDQGSQFDATGNFSDWWTAEDKKKFESRTACLVNEYGGFTAVDDVKVNGKLTLGENTADNGGALIAYMAYLARAKKEGIDITKKMDGYTGPQRFYIAYAQNWCENPRPEQVREQVLTDPHPPDHFRANGAVVNQPGFSEAFSCKKGTPMAPANNCRVW